MVLGQFDKSMRIARLRGDVCNCENAVLAPRALRRRNRSHPTTGLKVTSHNSTEWAWKKKSGSWCNGASERERKAITMPSVSIAAMLNSWQSTDRPAQRLPGNRIGFAAAAHAPTAILHRSRRHCSLRQREDLRVRLRRASEWTVTSVVATRKAGGVEFENKPPADRFPRSQQRRERWMVLPIALDQLVDAPTCSGQNKQADSEDQA